VKEGEENSLRDMEENSYRMIKDRLAAASKIASLQRCTYPGSVA
jgi:hypothetical protein